MVGRRDERRKLAVRHRSPVDPEAVDRDTTPVLPRIEVIGAHHELASRNPAFVGVHVGWRVRPSASHVSDDDIGIRVAWRIHPAWMNRSQLSSCSHSRVDSGSAPRRGVGSSRSRRPRTSAPERQEGRTWPRIAPHPLRVISPLEADTSAATILDSPLRARPDGRVTDKEDSWVVNQTSWSSSAMTSARPT